MKRSALLCLSLLSSACGASATVDAGTDAPITDAPIAVDAPLASDVPPADTWSTFAMGFFQTYCVECHAGPPSGRDYRTIADVTRDAARIRCGTAPAGETQSGCGSSPAPGMFPIGAGARPSDADRRRLVAWIEAGLPE